MTAQHRTAGLAGVALVVSALVVGATGLFGPSAHADPFVTSPVDGEVVRFFDPPGSRFGPGHRGVDLAAEPGDVVRSALGGTVSFAGQVAGVGWVTVDHGGGLDTTYGPVTTPTVRRGQRVRTGQVIGRLDDEADHLDWGARMADEYIDPLGLLVAWEITLIDPDDDIPTAWASAATLRGGPSRLRTPVQGSVTSGFGARVHPVTGATRIHAGLDLAAPAGTPVRAAAAGKVTMAGELGGYGQVVTVLHAGGVETRYAHLSSIAVDEGDQVGAGQDVGAVGSTGVSTGPHLHFEVRVGGVAQDPLAWLGG